MSEISDLTLHATCVALGGRGLLILGPSGAGKSALALQMMALGATLVSDDRTELRIDAGHLIARAPSALFGLIEARGVGLLRVPALAEAPVHLVVDLAQTETDRLPPHRKSHFLGATCDLVLGSQSAHFPAAMMCYLKNGRYA